MEIQTEIESESLKDFEFIHKNILYGKRDVSDYFDTYIFTDHKTTNVVAMEYKTIFSWRLYIGFKNTPDYQKYHSSDNWYITRLFHKIFKMLFQEQESIHFSHDNWHEIIVHTENLRKRLFIPKKERATDDRGPELKIIHKKNGKQETYVPDYVNRTLATKLLLEIVEKFREHRVLYKTQLTLN